MRIHETWQSSVSFLLFTVSCRLFSFSISSLIKSDNNIGWVWWQSEWRQQWWWWSGPSCLPIPLLIFPLNPQTMLLLTTFPFSVVPQNHRHDPHDPQDNHKHDCRNNDQQNHQDNHVVTIHWSNVKFWIYGCNLDHWSLFPHLRARISRILRSCWEIWRRSMSISLRRWQ